jgi:hypothetical protein
MKTNFFLLIVVMLTFSIGNAQSAELNRALESSKTISVTDEDNNQVKESLLIDASKLKTTISRSSSDIRIYLNRKRNVGNISLVFPAINKAVKA